VAQSFADTLCTGVSNAQIDYTFMFAPQKVDLAFVRLTEELFGVFSYFDHLQRQIDQNLILTDVVDKMLAYGVLQHVLKTYAKAVGQKCAGRRFGIIECGRMGLFPDGVKVGDEVGLVAGAKVPLVLREVKAVGADEDGRCFKLVGPAFVKGIMYGEGVNGNDGFEMIRIR
jgi:hypothetical protein